jgi:MFS family permease
LVIFGLCVMLFHFANAPLLPLVGQKLAAAHPKAATAMMSACIVAAQMVMLPIALLVGSKADIWGRKPLFLAGFAILPLRAVLYTLSDDSAWLIGVQLLDGVGAGIFGALAPLVVADIMQGTGRYNLALGAIATAQGIGASVSGLAAGEIVDHFGYASTFLSLGAAALAALMKPPNAPPDRRHREGMPKSAIGGRVYPGPRTGCRSHRHFPGDISGHRHRKTALLSTRPRGRGAAGREPDGRLWRHVARSGLSRD